MRKLFYSSMLITFLACPFSSISQVNLQEVEWTVVTGLNVSGFGGDLGKNIGSKPGFHMGVTAAYPVYENLYLKPGLYLNMKGAKETYQGDKDIYTLTYLEIPVLASYRINIMDEIKWEVNFGPSIGCGLTGKNKYKPSSGSNSESPLFKKDVYEINGQKYEDPPDFKRFDIGLNIGTGVSYDVFYFGLNYQIGLANILNKDQWPRGYSGKNKVFMLSLGYHF